MFISAFLESPMSSLKPYAKKKHMLEVKVRMEETLFTRDHLIVLVMYLRGEHPLCETIK